MKKIIQNSISSFLTIVLLCLIFAIPIYAQDAFGSAIENLGDFNDSAQLPTAQNGLVGIVVNIINIILGLLGLIFVILIIYQGFKYMTAGGNTEQTQTAIKAIRDGAIGVTIIFSSYIIVNFVILNLLKAFWLS